MRQQARLAAAVFLVSLPLFAAPTRNAPRIDPSTGARTFELWDGSTATVGKDGVAVRTSARGHSELLFTPEGASDLSLLRMLSLPRRGLRAPDGGFWGSSMAVEPRSLAGANAPRRLIRQTADVAGIPSNYGLQTSFQAHLNSTGVAATGAF